MYKKYIFNITEFAQKVMIQKIQQDQFPDDCTDFSFHT